MHTGRLKFIEKWRQRILVIPKKSPNFASDFIARAHWKKFHKELAPRGNVKYIYTKMYAIVIINGQQFKVEEGKKLFVHHIRNAEAGQTVEFDKVLLIADGDAVKVGAPVVEGAKVVVEVNTPLVKGDKVIVFKMKRRKDSRKKNGHRQQFSEVTVKSIVA